MKAWRWGDLKYYAGLAIVVLAAYWPISFGIFSLKYDAVMYFLPWRFHISEAIQNGEFPFWSPFLYTGSPLHADMQSGAWNPLVWVLSLFGRYNMFTLQLETTIYLVIAAIGFFKLARQFQFHCDISFVCAAAYCCNGFFVDSITIIPWITSAAYMPFVFLYFFRMLEGPGFNSVVKLSIALALLFTASYPSFFLITGYVLIAMAITYGLTSIQKRPFSHLFRVYGFLLLSAIFTSIICLPVLISYLEFFPYYNRSEGVALSDALFNPFHIRNLISYITPTATYKIEAGNDRMARNAYIGIFLLLFLAYSFRKKWKYEQWSLLVFALIFFCFSLGAATPLRSFLYNTFPFMDRFRHPANARIFTNGALILLAAYGLQEFVSTKIVSPLKKYISISAWLMLAIVILSIMSGGDFFTGFPLSFSALKEFKDSASFTTFLLLSALVQLVFLGIYYWRLKSVLLRPLIVLTVTNLIVFTWFSAPFNIISKHSTAESIAFTSKSPYGFPIASLSTNVSVSIGDSSHVTDLGYEGFYQKQLIIHDRFYNPTLNKSYTDMILNAIVPQALDHIPPVTFEKVPVKPLRFSANSFSVQTTTDSMMNLLVLQQYNHNWQAYVDDKPSRISKLFIAYMTVDVPAGVHEVTFRYEPRSVINSSYWAIGVLVFFVIYLLVSWIRSSSPSMLHPRAHPSRARHMEK
jgi:hypothetical protein